MRMTGTITVCYNTAYTHIIQIVMVAEVTIGNCFPEFGKTLPDAVAVKQTNRTLTVS